jgi:hypothetical protein
MKTKTCFIISFVFFIMGISSCEKNELAYFTSIKYGSSFGMCIGNNCFRELKVTSSQVFYTAHGNGSSSVVKNCISSAYPTLLQDINELISEVDLNQFKDVIGCPDCADGGAEWIEVAKNGKTKKITFEYGKAPAELDALIKKLRPISDSFINCN